MNMICIPHEYAILLPGSQAAGWLKRWGAERYAELAKIFHARGIRKVLLLGGADELEECCKNRHLCVGATGW